MRFSVAVVWTSLWLSPVIFALPSAATGDVNLDRRGLLSKRLTKGRSDGCTEVLSPKVMIINLFTPEAEVWYNIPDFDLLAINVTVPGFSPILPDAHCTADGQICQVVTGEGECNAGPTISALTTSDLFDLSSTYMFIAGIAGINPACGTLGTVSFAKYAVQGGLEYEIDPRELPNNYSAYHIPLGATAPNQYPVYLYGSEVFELNAKLQNRAVEAAKKATLSDSPVAKSYRTLYPDAPANQPPTVIKGDVMTSDAFWHGTLLGDAYSDYFTLLTNGSGKYCMTAQEDNAAMESMVRAALFGLVDFSRVISMRTAANFDRPPPGETAAEQLFYINQGGFVESTTNIYLAGVQVVNDIVHLWDRVYKKGVKPENYIGDIFDSLKGDIAPDIGNPFFQTG